MNIEEIECLRKRYKKLCHSVAEFESFAVVYLSEEDLKKLVVPLTEIRLLLNDLDFKARYEDEN